MAWSRLLLAAVILGVPVMLLHMSAMYSASVHLFVMKPAACSGGVTAGQMIMVLLNVPLQFGVGYRFYRSALLGNTEESTTHTSLLYYTKLYYTILYYTILYYTVFPYPHCVLQYHNALYYVLCDKVFYTDNIMYYTVVYCTMPYYDCTALYCIVVWSITLPYSAVSYSSLSLPFFGTFFCFCYLSLNSYTIVSFSSLLFLFSSLLLFSFSHLSSSPLISLSSLLLASLSLLFSPPFLSPRHSF